MSCALTKPKPSWAASSRPPIAPASAGASESFRLAHARRMVGRVGPGHDGILCYFNAIKYFFQIIFPFQILFLYWSDGSGSAHAPHLTRHCGGAFARAESTARGRGCEKTAKSDEQFCCRSVGLGWSEPRQPQRRGCARAQSQRTSPWPALASPSREARRAAQALRHRSRAVQKDAGAGQGAERGARRSSSWPGSSCQSIRRVSTRRKDYSALADANAMGGRVEPGHDGRE